MLKLRVITAAILIPIVLYILFAASPGVFRFATAVVVCLAAWEWPTLMGDNNPLLRMGYVIMLVAFLFISHFIGLKLLLILTALSWLILGYWVLNYPAKQPWAKKWRIGMLGIIVILPFYLSLNYLRELPHAHSLLFLLLMLIWGADTSAYFVGRRYGRSKLIPNVSPNKSWQGFYAALCSGFLIALIAIIWLNAILGYGFIILALVTTLASILGDLAESMFKRAQGVKDSGNILPGHGGILDRIDSLTAAAPIYTLGIILLGVN